MYPTLESRADILKILDGISQSRRLILEQCDKMSAAQLHDPVYPGTWSVLQNLAHLAWAQAYMLAWIQKRPQSLARDQWPPEPPLEMPALRIALDEAQAATLAFLKSHAESVLKEKCVYGKSGEQTVGGVLFHLIEHEFHHRAFLVHKLAVLAKK
jgi:uncharacterized damage-inducible protein DinB